MKYNKLQVLSTMAETGMIPVFYNKNIDIAKNVLKACYDGGIRAFEFTNRGDLAHEVFTDLIKYTNAELPDMILGIGSIIDPATAALYMQLGANFVVGPCFNGEVAKVCNRRLVPYIPGTGSVTEISNAHEAGCDLVKVFPAGNVGGPSYVKNVLGPLPWSMLIVTGAVEPTRENLTAWIKAGVTCVGMGSLLFPPDAIKNESWEEVTNKCKESLKYIQEARAAK